MRLGLESSSPRVTLQASVRRRSLAATSLSSAFSPIDVDGDSTDEAEASSRNYHDLSANSSPSTRPSLLDLSSENKTNRRHQQVRDLHYESEPSNSMDHSPEEKQIPLRFFFNVGQRHSPEKRRDSSSYQHNNSIPSSPAKDELHEVISAARAIICGQKFDRCELEFDNDRVELTIWKDGKPRWQGKIKYAHMVRFCFSRVDHPPYILLLQLDNSKGRSDFATFFDPIFAEVCEKNEMKPVSKLYGVVFYFDDQMDYMRCQSMGDNILKLEHLFKEKLSDKEVRELSRLDVSTKSRYPLRSEPKGSVTSSSSGSSLTKSVMNGAKHAIGSVASFFSPIPRSSVLETDENPSVVRDHGSSIRGRTLNLSRENTEASSVDSVEEKTAISIDDTNTGIKDHGSGLSTHNDIETVVLLKNTQRESGDNAFEVDASTSSAIQKEEITNESVESKKRAPSSRREDEKLKRRKLEDRRNEVLLNYPYDGSDTSGRISVTFGDVDRLVPGEFLNDNIIDFYLRYLWRHLGPLDQQRMYFYTSHFFTQLNGTNGAHELATTDPNERFARVARWTQKETNLFDKQFLFIPINDSFHWSIAVFCNPGSAIIKKHRFVRRRRRDVGSTEKREVVDLVDDGGSGEGVDGGKLEAMDSGDDNVEVEVEENEVLSCQEDRLVNPPCLLFLDSLRCHRKKKFTKMLRDYLECEWKSRYASSAVVSARKDDAAVANGVDHEDAIVTIFDSESIVLLEPNIPLQSNSSDCGVFLLMYAASIVRLFPASVSREDLEDNLTSRLTANMFSDEHVREFREYLQQLIFCLQFLEKHELPEEKVKDEELEVFTID